MTQDCHFLLGSMLWAFNEWDRSWQADNLTLLLFYVLWHHPLYSLSTFHWMKFPFQVTNFLLITCQHQQIWRKTKQNHGAPTLGDANNRTIEWLAVDNKQTKVGFYDLTKRVPPGSGVDRSTNLDLFRYQPSARPEGGVDGRDTC